PALYGAPGPTPVTPLSLHDALPISKNGKLNGGPQMVEVSRDGRRVYFTNSLYGAIDPQFYPEGIDGWMVKLDAGPAGGIAFDPKDRKSTRLNSSHVSISYAVFCLKK